MLRSGLDRDVSFCALHPQGSECPARSGEGLFIRLGGFPPMHEPRDTGRSEEKEKWAKIWFDRLAKFHRIEDAGNWAFDEQHVIGFLRHCLRNGMPTWKRLKIVEGLLDYRNRIRGSSGPALEPIRAKLQEILANERCLPS